MTNIFFFFVFESTRDETRYCSTDIRGSQGDKLFCVDTAAAAWPPQWVLAYSETDQLDSSGFALNSLV